MTNLIILYWGVFALGQLSQIFAPTHGLQPNHRSGSFLNQRLDVFTIVIIVWMTLFSGLRVSYNDTGNYIRYFEESATTFAGHFQTSDSLGFADNPMFYILQMVFKSLINNYHLWFIFVAFINAYVIVKLFKYCSESFGFSLLIFFSIGTYVMYMAAMKQCIAVSICICAIPSLLEKKWLRYYVLVFLAILFHTHSFIFLFVPLLMGKPWSKATLLCFAAMIFAMLTYDVTLRIFMEYGQSIGATVVDDEVFDNHTVNILRVAVYGVIPLLTLVFRRRLFQDSTKAEDLFANLSILSFQILAIGLVNGANLFARMAGYLEWANALCLPFVIKKVFNRRSQRLVFFLAAICYFGYFLYEFGVSKNFGGTYRAITVMELLQSLISG